MSYKVYGFILLSLTISQSSMAQLAEGHSESQTTTAEASGTGASEGAAKAKCDRDAFKDEEKNPPVAGLPFTTKFERQKAQNSGINPVFREEEKIKGKFFINIDRENKTITLLNQDVGDVRYADSFVIEGADIEKYECLEGIPLEGTVEVTGKGEYTASNMFKYPASIKHLKPTGLVDPTNEQLKNAKPGEKTSIEGKVIRITDGRNGVVFVEKKDGSIVRVNLLSGVPQYMASLSDKIADESVSGKQIQKGDVIRINGWAIGDGTDRMKAHWTRSSYLVSPSEDRLKSYEELKAKNENSFQAAKQALKKEDFPTFRRQIAEVRQGEPNRNERELIERYVAKVPDSAKPIEFDNRFSVEDVNKQFGVDVESMTQGELVQFAKDFASGKVKRKSDEGDETYIYRLLDASGWADKHPREMIDIQKQAVRTRMKMYRNAQAEGTAKEFPWDDKYTMGQTVNSLSYDLPEQKTLSQDDKAFIVEISKFYEQNPDLHGNFYVQRMLEQLSK